MEREESRTCAQPDRVFDQAALDLCVESGHALVIEWYFSTHQDVEDDSKTPHIHLGTGILLRLQQFRGRKIQGPAKSLQVISRTKQIRKPKINDLDVARLGNEDVFNFEV